jgi:hypothetical protein
MGISWCFHGDFIRDFMVISWGDFIRDFIRDFKINVWCRLWGFTMKLWGFHAKSHGENTLTWGDDGLAMFVVT